LIPRQFDPSAPPLQLIISDEWRRQLQWLHQHTSLDLQQEQVTSEVDVIVRGLPALLDTPPEPLLALLRSVRQAWHRGGPVHFTSAPLDLHLAPPADSPGERDCLVVARVPGLLQIHQLRLPADWFTAWWAQFDGSHIRLAELADDSPPTEKRRTTGTVRIQNGLVQPGSPCDGTGALVEASAGWIPQGFRTIDRHHDGLRWVGMIPSAPLQPGSVIRWTHASGRAELHVGDAAVTAANGSSLPTALLWPEALAAAPGPSVSDVGRSSDAQRRQTNALSPADPVQPPLEVVYRLGWTQAQTLPVEGETFLAWGTLSREQVVIVTDAGPSSFRLVTGHSTVRSLRRCRNGRAAAGFQRLMSAVPGSARVRMHCGHVVWGVPGEAACFVHALDAEPRSGAVALPPASKFVDASWMANGPVVLYEQRRGHTVRWYVATVQTDPGLVRHYRVPFDPPEVSGFRLHAGADALALRTSDGTAWFVIDNEQLVLQRSLPMIGESPVDSPWLPRIGLTVDDRCLVAMRFGDNAPVDLAVLSTFWWETVAAMVDDRGGLHVLERTENGRLQYVHLPASPFMASVSPA
jgi:hypothetical protein